MAYKRLQISKFSLFLNHALFLLTNCVIGMWQINCNVSKWLTTEACRNESLFCDVTPISKTLNLKERCNLPQIGSRMICWVSSLITLHHFCSLQFYTDLSKYITSSVFCPQAYTVSLGGLFQSNGLNLVPSEFGLISKLVHWN